MKTLFRVALSLASATVLIAAAAAQQETRPSSLTLHQAVTIALEKNPLRKAAVADTKAASAGVREARSFLMPHVTFSETATRGNDPVYVFGTELRQERLTTADFALNKLNSPLPLGNFATRFGGTWNLFDSFATWHGVNQAKHMNEAANMQLSRTGQETVFKVVGSYYAVLLAAKELEVAEQSAKTAQSILDRSQNRFDSGLTVESDLLTAKVRMAARQRELIRARNTVEETQAEAAEKEALANRPDLKRIASEEAAQRQSVSIAKSSFGPRVNAFAGWEMDNPTLLAGGGGNNWSSGIRNWVWCHLTNSSVLLRTAV